jgi:hypothetical protein
MEIVYHLVVVLHLVGMAVVVGSWLTVVRAPRLLPGMLHGALTQLVTGIALVGMRESGVAEADVPLDNAKIAVKLAVTLVVTVLLWVNRKRGDDVPAGVVHAVGGLALLNVFVAVLWE